VFPRIVGNDIEIREVFYNLLSNAAKYIDNDNGQVVVRVKPDGSHCIFSVTDNGPGIPYDEQARIFAPFRRLAQHDKCAGSGLGLYFTKQLVEKQGGRIETWWGQLLLDSLETGGVRERLKADATAEPKHTDRRTPVALMFARRVTGHRKF
jgi:hypothetical protein